jgi:hypothetical protein
LFKPDQELADRDSCNLSSPFALERAGRIHGDEIKWRWPRIRWAAEIRDAITADGPTDFIVPIRWRHAFAFPTDQIVHLRFRDIDYVFRPVGEADKSSYLIKEPTVSVPLRFIEAFTVGNPPVQNLRLRVEAGAPFTYPAAKLISPANIIATFQPGSIVYAPRPAPPGAIDGATYPYAELIAKNVRDFITTNGAPVGRSRAGLHPSIPEVPNFETLALPPEIASKLHPRIVALYEGGSGNSVGLFHPAGLCMMLSQDDASAFCHVCKYVLVDAIDPSAHFFLDPEYDELYPQR